MLTINELVQPTIAKSNRNHETYKAMYDDCAAHIKRMNDAGGRETTWTVPAFVFGRPPFTHRHAMNYVSEKLRRGGFSVAETGDEGKLHVDWKNASLQTARTIRAKMEAAGRVSKKNKSTPVKKKAAEKSEPLSVTLERLRKNLQLKPKK